MLSHLCAGALDAGGGLGHLVLQLKEQGVGASEPPLGKPLLNLWCSVELWGQCTLKQYNYKYTLGQETDRLPQV